ncbi:hypothetical protein AGABI1DRAFT_135004 [Agaricus bisporus var. burnettii JB137-S8]|uniref:Uncharacterized protein n=1 Tax=Agaricus bisporus var. burnettii (strain JB137-S8 / ATCC MYA-4627 / FGSC 10392) TaxID=597362 RepID=K5WRG1_AGABU|nr:uncharacterized protein AGABI1DRAFT_135004 [Agaricus bisporus var. burnettii JB137-S8]EKM73343.1 hypothetical protein AGABI1DRAFT_135004 [Agaricus bisporus var. burnettii JB137-S8]
MPFLPLEKISDHGKEIPLESDDEDAKANAEDDEPSNLYMSKSTVVLEMLKFEVDMDVDITSYRLIYLLLPTLRRIYRG